MDEQKNFVVYIHINKINNKKYVGITSQALCKRFHKGKGYLHKNKEGFYNQPRFAEAILEFGWENFEHQILFSDLTKEEAEQKEIELIKELNLQDPEFGYNIADGGSCSIPSEETCKKRSESLQKYFQEHPMTQETKDKISAGVKASLTPELRQKYSEAAKKRVITQEMKDKISESLTGRHWYTNGKINILAFEQPKGKRWKPGVTPNRCKH